jgi:hypothetical protein
MQTRTPHDSFLDPEPIARVFSIDHARRDKAALFARESDTDHERRHPERLLDGLNWCLLGALLYSLVVNTLAVVGLAWLIGQAIERIAAGGVL